MPAEAEKLITLRQGRYALKSFLHTPLLAVVRIPLTILPDHDNARRLNNVFDPQQHVLERVPVPFLRAIAIYPSAPGGQVRPSLAIRIQLLSNRI
jgi:hypothetical protein